MTDNDKLNARLSCNLAIPVTIMQGYALGIFSVDYRGYAIVPSDEGSYSEFYAEYFFAGNPGPTTNKRYVDYTGEVNVNDEVEATGAAMVYSECGTSDIIFRINTAIRARKEYSDDDDVFIEIDSTDTSVKQSFRYYMDSKACVL